MEKFFIYEEKKFGRIDSWIGQLGTGNSELRHLGESLVENNNLNSFRGQSLKNSYFVYFHSIVEIVTFKPVYDIVQFSPKYDVICNTE